VDKSEKIKTFARKGFTWDASGNVCRGSNMINPNYTV